MSYIYEKKEIYSIFDQFLDYEIDFSKYLVNNNIDFSNVQPVKAKVKNLFSRIDIITDIKKNPVTFNIYHLSENESAIACSKKNFGMIDYWWIIYMFNDIKNPHIDWPMTNEQLLYLVNKKYELENEYPRDIYYNILHEQNEQKRKIMLPTFNTIIQIISEFRKLANG